MKKTASMIMLSLFATLAFTNCGNKTTDSESTSKDSAKISEDKSTSKQNPYWYGSELADAKCKKETAKNEGNSEEARKWSEKMDEIKKAFEDAYPGDAEAMQQADEKYEYLVKKCAAMQQDEPADAGQEYADSTY